MGKGYYNVQLRPSYPEGKGLHLSETLADRCEAFIERNKQHPFFLYGAPYEPHLPLETDSAFIVKYLKKPKVPGYPCKPNALALFNPVIDNGPGGAAYDRIGEAYLSFSPLHNIRKGAPPTLTMLGEQDIHIPVVTPQYYKLVMEKVGSRCDLELYDHACHGFFNYSKNGRNAFYQRTLDDTEKFLMSLGYIKENKD